jgi:hypothetical protein
MRGLAGMLACGLGLTLLACTVSRQGTLETIPSGTVIPVAVSVEGDEVVVHGQSPATGETFDGRLLKVAGRGEGAGPWYPSAGGAMTPMPSGIGATSSGGGEQTIDVSGILEGDAGTRLRCSVQVARRLRLSGDGICRVDPPADNAATYRLKF